MPPRSNHKLAGLQALRFLAAALVVWAHLKFAVGGSKNPLVTTPIGAVGVDVFFVISGFVISMSADKIGRSWKLFFAHRIARVVPLYYLMSLPFICGDLLDDGKFTSFNKIWNTLLFIPIFDFGSFQWPHHHFGWTLCFEIWFYFIFGVCLAFAGGRAARLFVPMLLICGVICVYPFYHLSWTFPRFAFYPMVLEFCGGMLLYHFHERLGAKTGILLATCALPLALGVCFTDQLGWCPPIENISLGFTKALIWGGFALCLVGSVLCFERGRFLGIPAWVILAGDASYSLYLIQPFILRMVKVVFPTGGFLGGVSFVVGSFVVAIALYRFVERPMSRWMRPAMERVFRVVRQ